MDFTLFKLRCMVKYSETKQITSIQSYLVKNRESYLFIKVTMILKLVVSFYKIQNILSLHVSDLCDLSTFHSIEPFVQSPLPTFLRSLLCTAHCGGNSHRGVVETLFILLTSFLKLVRGGTTSRRCSHHTRTLTHVPPHVTEPLAGCQHAKAANPCEAEQKVQFNFHCLSILRSFWAPQSAAL